MMNRRFCLGFLALALAPKPVLASEEAHNLSSDLELVRAKSSLPALAAAVVRKGALIASGVTGVRAHGSDIQATINDRFHIGSDTKAMTAILAGILVDEGKLQWTSTIGDVLGRKIPRLPSRFAEIGRASCRERVSNEV
jgi:CubicO group peptidase (beta-lactamase class C family)